MTPGMDFSPPPAAEGSGYARFQFGTVGWVARWQTRRMRAVGIDAYGELEPVPAGDNLYTVWVAKPHLICAMVLWKLGFRGVPYWQGASAEKRARLAVKALVDCMLLHGGRWEDANLAEEGLDWLRAQLGLEEAGLQDLLLRARREFEGIAERDLRWGAWLSVSLLAGGAFWRLAFGTCWQAILLLILGAVFGVHTLAVSLPRWRRPGPGSDMDWQQALAEGKRLLQAGRTQESISYLRRSMDANPGEYGTASGYEEAKACLEKARELLARGKDI